MRVRKKGTTMIAGRVSSGPRAPRILIIAAKNPRGTIAPSTLPNQTLGAHENEPTCAHFYGPTKCAGQRRWSRPSFSCQACSFAPGSGLDPDRPTACEDGGPHGAYRKGSARSDHHASAATKLWPAHRCMNAAWAWSVDGLEEQRRRAREPNIRG